MENENIIEWVLDDLTGMLRRISLVTAPAHEIDFEFFNSQKELKFKTIDAEKRIITGVAMRPNIKILRIDENGEKYYGFFSENTVRKAAELFFKSKNINNMTNLEHQIEVENIYVFESWIVEDPKRDKATAIGLKDVKKGDWVVSMKVENDAVWENYIKTGIIKGFSIEVKADEKVVKFESYSDYPDAVKNNAKRGIELNENQGNKCATQTGKVRAQQLANGEPVSVDTIKRMYSYLSRAEAYYDENKTTECGTISYLLWGGLAAKRWSESKLKELNLLEMDEIAFLREFVDSDIDTDTKLLIIKGLL